MRLLLTSTLALLLASPAQGQLADLFLEIGVEVEFRPDE